MSDQPTSMAEQQARFAVVDDVVYVSVTDLCTLLLRSSMAWGAAGREDVAGFDELAATLEAAGGKYL